MTTAVPLCAVKAQRLACNSHMSTEANRRRRKFLAALRDLDRNDFSAPETLAIAQRVLLLIPPAQLPDGGCSET